MDSEKIEEDTPYRQREAWVEYESLRNNSLGLIIAGVLSGIIIILLLVLFVKKDKPEYITIEQFDKLKAQLYQLEERVVWQDEKIDSLQTSFDLQKQTIKEISKTESRQEEPKEPKVLHKIEQPTPIAKEPKEPVRKVEKKATSTVYKYHQVRTGETLYRIGLKYKISIPALRKLNNMGPNDSIHIGQRLLVGKSEQ